ncbi:MAG: hypothetical protein KAX05_03585 [Bacteroidales bacterium]|nr:hypothetical protein [Bacteroidales bacterium]
MEYKTGKIALREIFVFYWEYYISWYSGEIREEVKENVNKSLAFVMERPMQIT